MQYQKKDKKINMKKKLSKSYILELQSEKIQPIIFY